MRMDEAAGRRSRGRIAALLAMLCVLAAGVPAAAAADWPGPDGAYDWPGMKKCGSFPSTYRIYVYAGKGTRCGKARRVMKELWSGDTDRVRQHDSETHGHYATLTRYPGWRCSSGAGGGSCRKGKQVSGYQN